MKLVLYFIAVIQCGLGDPVIRYFKPPKPLSMKDVQRYVMETSKVLEELSKEHLWLLSRMTGTNNWKDLMGDEHPTWRKERVTGESSERVEGDDERQNRGEAEHRGKEDDAYNESTERAEVKSKSEVEDSSHAEEESFVSPTVDAVNTNIMQQPQITIQTTEDKSHSLHSHPQNPQTTNYHKPEVNNKIGYTTDIGHGNHHDPSLNYLAWKDKPIQHHVDPYGKPVKESENLQTESEVSKPLASVSPQVLNTQQRDVVFSPLSLNKPVVQVAAKPTPSTTPTNVVVSSKRPVSSNPLTRFYNTRQTKTETNTLPKGSYNPLALDYSYINDVYNDIDTVDNMLAESNLNSVMSHVQSDEPIKDPLAYPVQYYKSEALPNTRSKSVIHPAYHSRLEDNDTGW